MSNTRALLVSALAGVLLALVSAVLAEFLSGPQYGHRIDTSALPPPAKAILAESPGTPISTEQWRRLDKVMAQHGGGWPGGTQLFNASIRHSWYWFLLLPVLALAWLRRRDSMPLPVGVLVAFPSLSMIAWAFASAPAPTVL